MKNFLINISLAIGSCLLFLLAIEVGLRVTGLQTTTPNPPKIYIQDENPNISYKLKPNLDREPAYRATVSTDERGLRLNGKRKAENGKRTLAILGDSIAFGYGVNDDQTLAAQLSTFHFSLSTLNAAVPGYQLQQQRALYEDYVQDLNPDAVMLVFYWNDLDGLKPGILDSSGILRGHGWSPEDDNRSWLQKHSAFVIAFNKLRSLRASQRSQEEERDDARVTVTESVDPKHLFAYVRDLKSFSTILPEQRYFVIWPDNELHEGTRPALTKAAQDAGFQVIDLYHLFGNSVETHAWDTVHPSVSAIEDAAIFIGNQMRNL